MLSTPPREWDGRAAADRRNPALAFRGGFYSFDQLLSLRKDNDFAARNRIDARQAHYDRCQKQLDALGEPYHPYRSIVAWYCWRAAQLYAGSAPTPVTAQP